MNSYLMVSEFHRKFGHPAPVQLNEDHLNDPKWRELRVKLVAHELLELAQALGVDIELGYCHEREHTLSGKELEGNVHIMAVDVPDAPPSMVGTADALADLDYVVNGAAVCFGIPLPLVTAEVHRSNMSKLGADGEPLMSPDGKILKGPNYREPDIAGLLAHWAGNPHNTAIATEPPPVPADALAAMEHPQGIQGALRDMAAEAPSAAYVDQDGESTPARVVEKFTPTHASLNDDGSVTLEGQVQYKE
jgi:predicted HAD superfamily Cof-like phosphohydrolase